MKMCHCGEPLHYASEESLQYMERMVEALGEYIEVQVPSGRFRVPRHYIALHGLVASEVPALGFEKIA